VAATALTDRLVYQQQLGFVPRALVDEPCHLATAVVVPGAVTRWRGRPPSPWFVWATLSASVLIDVDHLPLEFGSTAWTAGTPRPYTHAGWVVAVLSTVAAVAGRRSRAAGTARAAMVTGTTAGAAWGLCVHFFRDVFTAPIALWWPVSSAGVQLPHPWYVVTLLALAAGPGGMPDRGGTAGLPDRSTRHAVARATSRPSALAVAASSSTLRPGRARRACTRISPTGMAPRMSQVNRATIMSSRGADRWTARPRSALGGPPCWARASHGPVVCCVASHVSSPAGR
jgi:LexA-binding, inner membrane-associated putative hydrolase